ncbi:MAG: SCO family protein [Proteobacteria bacterium]|nr:SCO family protein [Pseudomonadota bacterium]
MFPSRPWRRLLPLLCAALLAACGHAPAWQLNDVSGHLPDLQFNLTADDGKPATAADFRGKYVLMYFGYTHCPDVCPLTLVHLHLVMRQLGADADKTRILFVSVDPARDTPAVLHQYVTAFDPHVTGLTGTPAQIAAMAKRYRVAFNAGQQQPGGGYEVSHSSGIYIFDRDGRARLIGTSADSAETIAHDLKLLMQQD